jgi:nucleoid-associated protein YgaU
MQRAQFLADSLRQDSIRRDSLQRDSLWLAAHAGDSIQLDTILIADAPKEASKETPKEAPQSVKPQEATPSVTAQSATTVQSAATAQTSKSASKPAAQSATTAQSAAQPIAKPAAQPAASASAAQSATNETYSLQTKYEAVGTLTTHAIAPGETLRKIALKYYGHKEFSNYIVNYNAAVIKDPNQVPVGTVLNIPRLKAK